MSVDLSALRKDVEEVVTDADEVLEIADDLPLPAKVKAFIATAQKVLTEVKTFLDEA